MTEDKVCVLATANKNLAELAKTTLVGLGIEAEVLANDAGGMAPHLALFSGGSRVLVRPVDVAAAEEILKDFREASHQPPADPADDTTHAQGFLTRLRRWFSS